MESLRNIYIKNNLVSIRFILRLHFFREKNPARYPMISNRTTGPGGIKFNVKVSANVYVLNEEEVPALTTIGSDVLNVGPELNFK